MAAFLLLLLPALVYARIQVELSGSNNGNQPDMNVHISGEDVSVIDDRERSTFKLHDDGLKQAVQAYFGKRPTDAYLRSPTPFGDLYLSYGWRQVERMLRPKSARILMMSSEPKMMMEQIFENNSTKPATFNVGISQSVENMIKSSWSKGGDLKVGQEISYELDLEAFSLGGSTSMSYTSTWGEDYEKSETVTIGSTSAVEVLLQPGQAVLAELHATRGKMRIEIEYEASLSGSTAVNYADTYKGHHFWNLDIQAVMDAGSLPDKVMSSEIIEIGFYSNANIVVHDRSQGYKLLDLDV